MMDELPEGFILDVPQETPPLTGVSELPEGFILDAPVSEGPLIALGEPVEQVIGEVPGLVQPEDVTATMAPDEITQSKIAAQENQEIIDMPLQAIAGMRQSVTLPLAKVLEDSLTAIGIDVGDRSSRDLSKVNKYIEDYNKKHPDQLIHPATIGNIASQIAVPMAKTVKGVAATEAVLSALHGIGQREDYDDVILDATIGATFGAGSMTLFNRLTRNLGPLSYEAKLLIDKHPELKVNFPDLNRQSMNEEILGGVTDEDPVKNLMYNFWDTTFSLETGEWKGEDLSFCDLVRRNGFKIYANVISTTGHYGTYGWKGKFNDHLE